MQAGDVVIVRYEAARRTRYAGNALSHQLPQIQGAWESLRTDYRWPLRGTSGLSIGHVSPEVAAGGAIALIEPGDPIEIDIPARTNVLVDDATLASRREAMDQRPRPRIEADRPRQVSTALKVYASMVTSADKGAIRDQSLIKGCLSHSGRKRGQIIAQGLQALRTGPACRPRDQHVTGQLQNNLAVVVDPVSVSGQQGIVTPCDQSTH